MTLGSDAACDITLADRGVSRRHAQISDEGEWVTLTDLGSSNGTWVNGTRITEPVEIGAGDEIQLGDAVLEVIGADAATQVMGAGAAVTAAEPITDEHSGPPAAPQRHPAPASARPAAAPRRRNPVEEGNLPALAAVFLGPLSIFLLIFSSGAAFFVSLPAAIAAIVFGNIGMRKVDKGESDDHRALANIGKITGIIGTALSTVALLVFLLVAALLDSAEGSLSALLERVSSEFGLNIDLPGGFDEVDLDQIRDGDRDGLEQQLRDALDRIGD